jgi:WD40 repeat protein
MDLLVDIGRDDQLTSAREENAVLRAKVKELTVRVVELKVENEALRAEVEMYREDLYRVGKGGGGWEGKEGYDVPPAADAVDADDGVAAEEGEDEQVDFVTSGNGMYPSDPAATLPDIHGQSNPLCCSLHPDDSLLATGGADSNLRLCHWGTALAPGENSPPRAVAESISVPCGAPVICCAFARVNGGRGPRVIAAGCMDGNVRLAYCGFGRDGVPADADRLLKSRGGDEGSSGKDGIDGDAVIGHSRYVKTVCWSPTEPILASASADGTVQLTRVSDVDVESCTTASIEMIKSIHFDGPVESMCYLNDGNTLCCYVRGTSYLSYLDLRDNFKLRKVSLNGGAVGTGGFDDHVSFAVLSMSPSPRGKYIALATDASRNIVMEVGTTRIVRNLYGHKNDMYSNPKIAWSKNGQYIYGNSQDENCICVWDVASASMVRRLDEGYGGHGKFVRDICSSGITDTVASVSFDKTAKIWLSDV